MDKAILVIQPDRGGGGGGGGGGGLYTMVNSSTDSARDSFTHEKSWGCVAS